MKLIVLRENLKKGLQIVERAVLENNNLPILKNVLLKTFNNKIQLSATNLEIAITTLISGKITEEGSITVPLNTLSAVTNNLNNERISLENTNNVLQFKTDNYEASIQGLPEDEFPIVPKIENVNNYLQLDSDLFKKGLLKVINAVQVSEIRPEISGVLVDFQVTNFKLAATDSFRLAEKSVSETNFKSNFQRGFKVIVPLKTAQELLKIISGGPLNIFIDPNQILFKNEETEIISRLISGNYPDYDQIVPKSMETELVLDREQLASAVKLVSTFSGKINDIKIRLKDGKKSLEIYSASQYLGENRYLVPVKAKGKEFDASFNWRYLMDGLKNFEAKELTLGVNGDNRPTMLKNPEDASYFYILMPIKV